MGPGGARRQQDLLLLVAHRAKGLDFDHVVVLDGSWQDVSQGEDPDAPRRLYYVAMTRARHSLGLMRLARGQALQRPLHALPAVIYRDDALDPAMPAPELSRRYIRLGLREVFIGFAGYREPRNRVHRAIGALMPGDHLDVRSDKGRWTLLDGQGTAVGQLPHSFRPPPGMRCVDATVFAIVTWERALSSPEHQDHLRAEPWEVVVPELASCVSAGSHLDRMG